LKTTFQRTESSAVIVWTGSPNCNAAASSLLEKLRSDTTYFLNSPDELTNPIIGNLGEYISFTIGRVFDYESYYPFPANALNPLSRISRSELDIVWCHFGEFESDDLLVLQEVKTTFDPLLAISSKLVADYKKLFDTDPAEQLSMRIQAVKNAVQYSLGKPNLLPRLNRLQAPNPGSCKQIRVVPTLVHEKIGADPIAKLVTVRTSLVGLGWAESTITPWSISLADLETKLGNISTGKSE
jgi:hypothetical protein